MRPGGGESLTRCQGPGKQLAAASGQKGAGFCGALCSPAAGQQHGLPVPSGAAGGGGGGTRTLRGAAYSRGVCTHSPPSSQTHRGLEEEASQVGTDFPRRLPMSFAVITERVGFFPPPQPVQWNLHLKSSHHDLYFTDEETEA